MKRSSLLALILALLFLLPACGQPVSAPAEAPAVTGSAAEAPAEAAAPDRDDSGRYLLSDTGEAIIDDVDLSRYAETEDNARVFYEIFVGSFSDSDGDGIGDLRGIIDRFDYLNDGDPASGLSLGVEGIWLTPIYDSPSYHKYDVTDYYAVDPDFGTMEDLKELADLCESRNVKLILDLPINHTGNRNAWFSSFVSAHRNKDAADPYYDFYCWYGAGESAPAGRTFAPISGTEDYYECNFDSAMPELNFDNDLVRQAVLDVAKYYLDLGVDGFRFDAAKYVYFGDNAGSASFWDWYMAELRKIDPEIYVVAEVWDGDGVTDQYYGAMNCFNFSMSQTDGLIASTAKTGSAGRYTSYVEGYLRSVRALREDAMLVPFISNHDMDRAAGYLQAASFQMQMAANLYILGPGSPFLYYGEEIGLRGSRGGANTDANRRLAMLWGDGDTVRDPEGSTYRAQDNSVQLQLGQSDSLYNYYKRLILIRRANPEVARGEYSAVSVPNGKAGGFVSTWEGSSVCVLHNPAQSAVTIDLAALGLDFDSIAACIGAGEATLEGSTLTLGGQTSVVLR